MKFGAWNVKCVVNRLPQKVATAFGKVQETIIGATYEPVAYLGSQIANGTNHAVLAQQTIANSTGTKNAVILKFNERGMDCSLYAIEQLVDSNDAVFGGYSVNIVAGNDIPAEAVQAFKDVTCGWVGTKIEPVALLATKVVKGVDYTFLAMVTPVVQDATASVKLVTVNSLANTIDFVDVLN